MSNIKKIYNLIYRRLHWSIAIIIISLLIAGQQFNWDISNAHRAWGLTAHSTLGILVLCIALLLIVYRFILRAPTPKPNLPLLKLLMAKTVQLCLYGLAIAIPVTGIACALHSEQPVYVLGVFNLSGLQVSIAENFNTFRNIHTYATQIAIALVLCHAGAALYHHFIKKDSVLKSMAASDPLIMRLFNILIEKSGRKSKARKQDNLA
ncbi:cytochrome b [Thalassotalea aquiviva]|uniref:cytochrome b n=1 Tax=Thalassotalea aquiviva TaxID=3242415 RepID=UPI00352A1A72